MTDKWLHKFIARRRVDTLAREYGRKYAILAVEAGLHQLGEQRPYFAVSADLYAPGHPHSPFACGCLHDEVLRFYPKLKPIIDLHLCDDTGAPMHAEANGWYDLAGYYGGANEQYHVGNSDRHFPITPPKDKPWQTTEYRKPTKEECLVIFAEHVRISVEDARELADKWAPPKSHCDELAGLYNWTDVRKQYEAWIETQRPRWQAEADAAVALLDQLAGRTSAADVA